MGTKREPCLRAVAMAPTHYTVYTAKNNGRLDTGSTVSFVWHTYPGTVLICHIFGGQEEETNLCKAVHTSSLVDSPGSTTKLVLSYSYLPRLRGVVQISRAFPYAETFGDYSLPRQTSFSDWFPRAGA